MFENLQLFDELNNNEIVASLKDVLTKKRALVVLLPHEHFLRLIPFERDDLWENRSKDVLETLKVNAQGFEDFHGGSIWLIFDWLYDSEGLRKLLNAYCYNAGLYWVGNGAELATEVISNSTTDHCGNRVLNSDVIQVEHLFDNNGIKLEALYIETYHNKKASKSAWLLFNHRVPIRSLGTADPMLNLVTPRTSEVEPISIEAKQVRRDEVTSYIHEYLAGCAQKNIRANIDDCWKFLADKLDQHLDGYLIWHTQKNEPKHLTKKLLSSRLVNARGAYPPK